MRATPFLMFQGQGQDALALYRAAFPDFELLLLQEHPADGAQAGQILSGRIRVGGLEIKLNDEEKANLKTSTDAVEELLVACKNLDGDLA